MTFPLFYTYKNNKRRRRFVILVYHSIFLQLLSFSRGISVQIQNKYKYKDRKPCHGFEFYKQETT